MPFGQIISKSDAMMKESPNPPETFYDLPNLRIGQTMDPGLFRGKKTSSQVQQPFSSIAQSVKRRHRQSAQEVKTERTSRLKQMKMEHVRRERSPTPEFDYEY